MSDTNEMDEMGLLRTFPTHEDDLEPVYTKTKHSQDDFFRSAAESGLNHHLDKLLERRRLNYADQDVQDLYTAITKTLNSLKAAIINKQRRFDGELIGVGSYHDGTKLAPADEYDFMYRLDGSTLEDNYECQRITTTQQSANITFRDFTHGRLRLMQLHEDIWYDSIDTVESMRNVQNSDVKPKFSSREFIRKFQKVVDDSMKSLTLPNGLVHGGMATPNFTGTDRNGPAVMLLFLWQPNTEQERDVTVDLIISFTAPHKIRKLVAAQLPASLTDEVVNELTMITGPGDEDWVIATSIVEQKIITTMLDTDQRQAVQNKILLGKIINNDYLTLVDDPEYEEPLTKLRDQVHEFKQTNTHYKDLSPKRSELGYGSIRSMTTTDIIKFLAVESTVDPGLKKCHVASILSKKRAYADAFVNVHSMIRRSFHEKAEPHCTIVSCMFKVITLTQHFELLSRVASGERQVGTEDDRMVATSAEMLSSLLEEFYGLKKSRTTLLEMTAPTWKCGTFVKRGMRRVGLHLEIEEWCKTNFMMFFYKLLNAKK